MKNSGGPSPCQNQSLRSLEKPKKCTLQGPRPSHAFASISKFAMPDRQQKHSTAAPATVRNGARSPAHGMILSNTMTRLIEGGGNTGQSSGKERNYLCSRFVLRMIHVSIPHLAHRVPHHRNLENKRRGSLAGRQVDRCLGEWHRTGRRQVTARGRQQVFFGTGPLTWPGPCVSDSLLNQPSSIVI